MLLLAAMVGGIIALAGYQTLEVGSPGYTSFQEHQKELLANPVPVKYENSIPANLDFRGVSKMARNSVVYIQSDYESKVVNNGFFQFRQGPSKAAGSGVIISDDGYIVTNNHVVENASDLKVTLNDNRSYEAQVIGTDPNTDLALIKIKEKNLPFLKYGDSDDVEVGQWVLAVGNPFNLTSTVTAGIISAKARNIGILRSENNYQIESFLQTDAVVNPGNSGGALINSNGELIGINTAIASNTGSYTGYAFAVPVNLVKKVMDDLLKYGVAQRALLGIHITDVNADLSKQEDLSVVKGVYVAEVNDNSSASDAGIKKGDVIVGINDKEVENTSELQEYVAIHRPGDVITVHYIRNGKEKIVKATLKNSSGTTRKVERVTVAEVEGSEFSEISNEEKQDLGIDSGVKLEKLKDGKWKDLGLEEGFIITQVDKQKVTSVDQFKSIMDQKHNDRVVLLGIFPDGTKSYYDIDW